MSLHGLIAHFFLSLLIFFYQWNINIPLYHVPQFISSQVMTSCVCVKSLSRVLLFATPWTVAHQASMGFSRQEYWSGLPFPSPGDLPDPGIEPRSPALQVDALTSEPPGLVASN